MPLDDCSVYAMSKTMIIVILFAHCFYDSKSENQNVGERSTEFMYTFVPNSPGSPLEEMFLDVRDSEGLTAIA